MSKLAIIRIRTSVMMTNKIEDTLKMLRLHKKYSCSIWQDNPSLKGMLNKVKGYVTWGDIDDATEKSLLEKFGEKRFYRLHPPRGGFERKGIKMPFKLKGALGDRKDKINALIQRMLP